MKVYDAEYAMAHLQQFLRERGVECDIGTAEEVYDKHGHDYTRDHYYLKIPAYGKVFHRVHQATVSVYEFDKWIAEENIGTNDSIQVNRDNFLKLIKQAQEGRNAIEELKRIKAAVREAHSTIGVLHELSK
jgi:hypothetical protein